MSLHAAFDSAAVDWCALYASASDAPNLFGITGIDSSALRRTTAGTGASSSAGTIFSTYGDERAKYGKRRVTWITGTSAGTSARIVLGYNGSAYDLSAQASGAYSIVLWAKLASGSSTDTFRLRLLREGDAVMGTSSAAALNSTTWTRFAVSGNNPGSNRLYGWLSKDSGLNSLTVEIAGVMIVSGSTAPDYFNAGADTLAGVLTNYAMEAKWAIGFTKAYQHIAPLNRAELMLDNNDRRFSPEYSSGALYGELEPGRLLQIGDPAYGIKGTYWTEDWKPLPGSAREKYAILTATDARRFLDKVTPEWGLQEPTITDQLDLVDTLLNGLDMPLGGVGIEQTDFPISFEVGGLANHGYHPPFYGDANLENADVVGVLADIIGSAQGHFWFNRAGQWNASEQAGSTAAIDADQTITDADWIDADYARDTRIINACDVTIHPKKASSGSANVLWELDESITLAAGETESFRVNFRNTAGANGDKIIVGGKTLTTANFTLAVGTVPTHVTVNLSEIRGQSALLTLTNISGISRTVTAGEVQGTKIIALRTIVRSYEDATSIAAYGRQALKLDFDWVSTRAWGKRLAKWVVERWKTPTYIIPWLTLNAAKSPQLAHDCYTGASVLVEDTWNDHSRVYGVIGEHHTARKLLTDYTIKLYLEPMHDSQIFGITP